MDSQRHTSESADASSIDRQKTIIGTLQSIQQAQQESISDVVSEQSLTHDLSEWLTDYLHPESKTRYPTIPGNFLERVSYLIECARHSADPTEAVRVGDAAFAILRSSMPEVLACLARAESPSDAMATFLQSILSIIGALPVSQKHELLQYLNTLRAAGTLKCWPTESQDCHRKIVLALGRHLRDESGDEWAVTLQAELHSPRYAVAALSGLAIASPAAAADRLVEVIALLDAAGIPSRGLLFWLSAAFGKGYGAMDHTGKHITRS